MAKKRRKRKSRTELYRIRRLQPTYWFVVRGYNVQRGGNPFGLGEYTLRVSSGPEAGLDIPMGGRV